MESKNSESVNLTADQSNTMVKKWHEKDGIIYFSVTSNGKTAKEWLAFFESKKITLYDYGKEILLSKSFVPTNGITFEVAIIKGSLFNDSERTTKNISDLALKNNFEKPNIELLCLIIENCSDLEIKEMDLLWVVDFHEPVKLSFDDSCLLVLFLESDPCVGAYSVRHDNKWYHKNGFVFLVSQISA